MFWAGLLSKFKKNCVHSQHFTKQNPLDFDFKEK